MLLNVVVDLSSKGFADLIFVSQLLEDLQVLALLDVPRPYLGDEGSHTADVVGEHHAACGHDKHHAKCLLVASRHEIPKAYCQHGCCSPVVSPNINLEPRRVIETFLLKPIFILIDLRHSNKNDSNSMSEAKVKQE